MVSGQGHLLWKPLTNVPNLDDLRWTNPSGVPKIHWAETPWWKFRWSHDVPSAFGRRTAWYSGATWSWWTWNGIFLPKRAQNLNPTQQSPGGCFLCWFVFWMLVGGLVSEVSFNIRNFAICKSPINYGILEAWLLGGGFQRIPLKFNILIVTDATFDRRYLEKTITLGIHWFNFAGCSLNKRSPWSYLFGQFSFQIKSWILQGVPFLGRFVCGGE